MAKKSSKTNHSRCADVLKKTFTAMGVDVNVSAIRPLFPNPYLDGYESQGVLSCPHGVKFWAEPTHNQIMDWNRRGVR